MCGAHGLDANVHEDAPNMRWISSNKATRPSLVANQTWVWVELSNKFRELKSLIYDYRDKKENEIQELNQKQQDLLNEIEINQKQYEKLIDEATNEISSFIEKTNSENISQ